MLGGEPSPNQKAFNGGGLGITNFFVGSGVDSPVADCCSSRTYQYGAEYEAVEGSPAPPSLALKENGYWRFRWLVGTGNRSITVFVKQASNLSPRPTLKLRANAAVGLVADVVTTAASSVTWTAMTAAFVCTGTGVIWVEMWNNTLQLPQDPAYFDRISVI